MYYLNAIECAVEFPIARCSCQLFAQYVERIEYARAAVISLDSHLGTYTNARLETAHAQDHYGHNMYQQCQSLMLKFQGQSTAALKEQQTPI